MSAEDMHVALGLLHEAEARLNLLGGNWGPGAGGSGALVERIRDFLVKHGIRAGVPR